MLYSNLNNNTALRKSQAKNSQNFFKKNWDKDEKDFLSSLDFMMIQDLKKSGLTLETVLSANFDKFVGNTEELKKIIGRNSIEKQSITQACSLLKIPYFSRGESIQYCRVRLYPALNDIKYLSPIGSSPIPYVLPEVYEIKNKKNKEIWIVEGEKKTLKLLQEGEYVIGLSGVWNFKAGKDSDETLQNKEIWGDIKEFILHGRTFYIAYDADFTQNQQVRQAMFTLAITIQNLGGLVKIATWDGSKGKGIDDYLASGGDIVEVKQNAMPVLNYIEKNKEYINDALLSLQNIKLNDILTKQIQEVAKKCGILKKIFDTYLFKPEPPAIEDTKYNDYIIPSPYRNVNNMLCIVHKKMSKGGDIEETYDELCRFFVVKNTIKLNEAVELTLSFIDDKDITKDIVIDATGLGDTKKLAEQLNNSHIFITNKIAKNVADYIVNFMRVNDNIQKIDYISETGWNPDNSIFYAPTVYQNDAVKYSDDLTNKIAKKGSEEKQIELIREIFSRHTGASIVCLAGLASSLLKLLNIDNQVFYTRGLTGSGKTLSNLIMLSFFGNPARLKNIMNTTIVGTEIMLSKQKDMPILLDELETSGLKAEQTHNFLINLIYNFQSGTGRTRAQRNLSMRETLLYRGILFLTGERSINSMLTANTSEKANLGVYRRTLELSSDDIQLFDNTVNFGQIVENINKNYGHILQKWISYISQNSNSIISKYNSFKINYKIDSIGGKQDFILLLIFVYFEFISLFCIDINNNIINGIKDLLTYNKQIFNEEVADPTIEKEKYLNAIKEFALKSGSFIDRTNTDKDYRPPQRVVGQIESDGDATYYYYTISAFKDFCNAYNFEKERVLNFLSDNIEKKGKYLYYPKKILGHPVMSYCFKF
jgi:uncharacterized protein (DUF927 family)